jgi:hypothetical protein
MSGYFCHACGGTDEAGPTQLSSDTVACRMCGSELVELLTSAQQATEAREFHEPPQLRPAPAPAFSPQPPQNPVLFHADSGASRVTVVRSQNPGGSQTTQIVVDYPVVMVSAGGPPQPAGPLGLLELVQREVAAARQQSPHLFGAFPSPGISGATIVVGGGDGNLNDIIHRLLMQHEPNAQPTPQYVIDGLVAVLPLPGQENSSVGAGGECVVCQDELFGESSAAVGGQHASEAVVELPACRHRFHRRCITPWLQRAQTCPYCRQSVV